MSDTHLTPYIAVASDMDGTLLQPNHTATKETADVLSYISEVRRIPFVFATGRHHVDVLATKKKLGLKGYVITSNGARVHADDGHVLIKNDLPPSLARKLALQVIDDPEMATSIYQEDLWLISREAKDVTEFYEDNKDVFFYRLFDAKTHPSYENVYKVYYTSDNLDKLHALEKHLEEAFAPGEISAAYSLPFCLEVTAGTTNKGRALGQLLDEHLFPNSDASGKLSAAERQHALLQKCIAFGDGDNDFPLVTCVGKGCVMGNAQKPLLDKIDVFTKANPGTEAKLERIKKNTENGVPEKLKEVFGISDADIHAFVADSAKRHSPSQSAPCYPSRCSALSAAAAQQRLSASP